MAAIAGTVLTFLRPGHVLAFSEPIYGGTDYLFRRVLHEFGIDAVPFPADRGVDELEALLADEDRRKRLRMIYLETPPTRRTPSWGSGSAPTSPTSRPTTRPP